MVDKKVKKAIEKVCEYQYKSITKYFQLLEEHGCADRLDKREKFIMTMQPMVFKDKLLKELDALKDNGE